MIRTELILLSLCFLIPWTQAAQATVIIEAPKELRVIVDKKTLLEKIDSIDNPFNSKLPIPKIEKRTESIKTSTPSIKRTSTDNNTAPATTSSNQTEITQPTFTISGLVWNSDKPQAIVNNQIVDIGDKIDDWTVVSIGERGIEVSKSGKKFFLEKDFNKL